MRIVPLVLALTLVIGLGAACQVWPAGDEHEAAAPSKGAYGGPAITVEIYSMDAEPPLFKAIVRMKASSDYRLDLDDSSLEKGIATLRVTVERKAGGAAPALSVGEHQVLHPLGASRPREVRVMARLVTQGEARTKAGYVLAASAD